MSLKPIKKSDQNKSWMQSRRDRRKMIQPEYHLIVTEGTETEPPYFNAMGTVINNNYPDKINIRVVGKGDNTLSLYSKAKDLATKSANGYRLLCDLLFFLIMYRLFRHLGVSLQ